MVVSDAILSSFCDLYMRLSFLHFAYTPLRVPFTIKPSWKRSPSTFLNWTFHLSKYDRVVIRTMVLSSDTLDRILQVRSMALKIYSQFQPLHNGVHQPSRMLRSTQSRSIGEDRSRVDLRWEIFLQGDNNNDHPFRLGEVLSNRVVPTDYSSCGPSFLFCSNKVSITTVVWWNQFRAWSFLSFSITVLSCLVPRFPVTE